MGLHLSKPFFSCIFLQGWQMWGFDSSYGVCRQQTLAALMTCPSGFAARHKRVVVCKGGNELSMAVIHVRQRHKVLLCCDLERYGQTSQDGQCSRTSSWSHTRSEMEVKPGLQVLFHIWELMDKSAADFYIFNLCFELLSPGREAQESLLLHIALLYSLHVPVRPH